MNPHLSVPHGFERPLCCVGFQMFMHTKMYYSRFLEFIFGTSLVEIHTWREKDQSPKYDQS